MEANWKNFNSIDKHFSLLSREIEFVQPASGLFHYLRGKRIKYDIDQLESRMVFRGTVSNTGGEGNSEMKYISFPWESLWS